MKRKDTPPIDESPSSREAIPDGLIPNPEYDAILEEVCSDISHNGELVQGGKVTQEFLDNEIQGAFAALGIDKEETVLRDEIPLEEIQSFINPEPRDSDLDLQNLPAPDSEYIEGRYVETGKQGK